MRRALGVLVLVGCSSPPPLVVPPGVTHFTNLVSSPHVPSCTDASRCGSGDEPPPGGPHCGSLVTCRIHGTAQNRCEWIHNLEHGHLVLAYNCPAGCDEIVSALAGYHQALPYPRRAVVTPDPRLTSKVAAMVWGFTWSGEAFDMEKIEAVRSLQDVEAPEAGLGCSP